MYLPNPTAEPYLFLSSLAVGIAVPLVLVIFGLWMKNRRSLSLGFIAGSVFVFYLAYSYYAHLYSWDPEYATAGYRAWLVLAMIAGGTAFLIAGLLILARKTAIGTRLSDWLIG